MNKVFIAIIALAAFPYFKASGQSDSLHLSLRAAIELCVKNSPILKSTAAKISAAKGRYISSIAPPPAELSMANDYVPTGQGLSMYGEKTLGASQSFEFPTSYLFRASKFKTETEIINQEHTQSLLAVVSSIKIAYFTTLALQQHVRLAQENMDIAERFAKKADIRYTLGEATSLEKLAARTEYTRALNDLEATGNRLTSALAQLRCTIGFGKNRGRPFTLIDSLEAAVTPMQFDSLVDEALRNNPLIKIRSLQKKYCTAEQSLAWSSLLPQITLGVFSKKVRGEAQDFYGASLGLTLPLWFFADQRGKISEANANLAAAQADLQAAENSIFLTAHNACIELKNAQKQVMLYQKELLPQAAAMAGAALKSYEAGEVSYLELLQAKQTKAAARGEYIEALLDYNRAIVSLEEAIGNYSLKKGD